MIVLIERCREVIRFHYIKIFTELIRLLIFYDGYDSNTSIKLFDTSINGRKVIDNIIVSIRKCISLLKDIDSSLWDTLITAQKSTSVVLDVIEKFALHIDDLM